MIRPTILYALVLTAAVFSIGNKLAPAAPGPVAQQVPAAATDISGKWHFVLNTEGGDREQNALFKLSGNQVTGKWDTADVKGTYSDGDLDLAFPYNSDEAGMTATFKIKGKLKDGKLAGTWEFGDYNGAFSATRGN